MVQLAFFLHFQHSESSSSLHSDEELRGVPNILSLLPFEFRISDKSCFSSSGIPSSSTTTLHCSFATQTASSRLVRVFSISSIACVIAPLVSNLRIIGSIEVKEAIKFNNFGIFRQILNP